MEHVGDSGSWSAFRLENLMSLMRRGTQLDLVAWLETFLLHRVLSATNL